MSKMKRNTNSWGMAIRKQPSFCAEHFSVMHFTRALNWGCWYMVNRLIQWWLERWVVERSMNTRLSRAQSTVIYCIPFLCIDVRLSKHRKKAKSTAHDGFLALHCKTCACQPLLRNTAILARSKVESVRLIVGTDRILSAGDQLMHKQAVTVPVQQRNWIFTLGLN